MQTPYYEIDETKLNSDIANLKCAMEKNWGSWGIHSIAACSVKTNSLPWLLNHFRKSGFYAEVVSSEEYDLVMRLGFPASHIIYNGPIKERDLFFRVLCDGGMVNLDSSQELEWLEENAGIKATGILRVGLRVNIDFHRLVPDEVPADEEGSRFGYCEENGELASVIGRLRRLQRRLREESGKGRPGDHQTSGAGEKTSDIRIAGLHLHSSTKSRSVKAYAAVAAFAGEIASRYGLVDEMEYIDMGGGYYGGVPGKPTFDDYLPAIAGALKPFFNPSRVKLVMEPGVSMVSSSFSFVTSVRDIKQIGEHLYVVIDGSRLNLNPQVTRRWYPHHIAHTRDSFLRPILPSQEIVGATCMEYDRLFEIKDEPALRIGDQVVFDLAGGYTLCLTPLFIHYFPAVYVKQTNGEMFTARETWTNDEFLQKNFW